MKELLRKNNRLERRKTRVRGAISGTKNTPRLAVSRSNTSLYCQLIDDVSGRTLVSLHSKSISGGKTVNIEIAQKLGVMLGEKAKSVNIHRAVFDRRGRKYTGKIAAVADGVRKSGLTM